MSGNTAQAPTPDPGIANSAAEQVKLGREWLDFSKEQFKVSSERQTALDALTKQVTEKQLAASDLALAASTEDRQRYKTVFQPIEDKFIADATGYDSPERQAAAAAEAKADVATSAANAKAQAQRQAAGLGIKPGSGAWSGIDRAGELGTALASAGAQNSARTAVRDKGLALKADVVNLGRGLPAQSAAAASLGLNAGNSAVGLEQQNQNLFNSATGIVGAGYGGAQQGYAAQAATLGNLYNANMSSYNAAQQRSSDDLAGVLGAVGTGAGLIFSSEEFKENKEEIGEGEALEAVNQMPVESWDYKEGIADEGHHVGPYAEDFQAATGKGDGTTIPVQDAIGISMKAIQDLDKKVSEISKIVGLGIVKDGPQKVPAKPAPAPRAAAKKPSSAPGIGLRRAA